MSTYRDFDYNFTKDMYDGVSFIDDNAAIKQAIKDILMTCKGERIWNPRYGTNIPKYLFEKVNKITGLQIKDEILFALENWEPRIRVLSIKVNEKYDEQTYDVYITYEIINLGKVDTLNIALNVLK